MHHSLPSFSDLTVRFFHHWRSLFWCFRVPSPTTVCASESLVAQISIPYFDQSPPLLWPTPVLRPQEAAEKNESDESELSPSPVCQCLAPALLFLCPDQSPSHFVVLQCCLSAFTSRRAPSSHSKNNGKSCFLLFLFFLFFFFLQFRVHRARFRCLRPKCGPPSGCSSQPPHASNMPGSMWVPIPTPPLRHVAALSFNIHLASGPSSH